MRVARRQGLCPRWVLVAVKTLRSGQSYFRWLASTLRRADWLFLRLRGLETLLKLPEVILSDLETLALMSSWGWQRQAASFMAN